MKKSILTLAIAIASLVGINSTSSAATHDRDAVTTIKEITRINKIEVRGNVELYLSDGTSDQVKVYNNYYSESALVQNQNGVLKISSYKTEKLVLWITVTDLRNLSVYDNARVKSFGKLSAIDLDVKLYNDASAQLNLDAYEVSLKVNDHAKADVAGTINEAELTYDYCAFLNVTNLSSTHMVKKVNLDYPGKTEKNLVVEL